MKFLKKNLSKILFVTSMVISPVISFAQGSTPPPACLPGQICNPINTSTIQDFIRVLLEGVLKIGIPIVALAVIYCGFLFVAAIGNSEKIKKAKEAFFYTLIGAAILLGSWAIAKLVADTVLAL